MTEETTLPAQQTESEPAIKFSKTRGQQAPIPVTIATPMRAFPPPEIWNAMPPEEQARHMPPFVGKALKEFATRRDPRFRAEADKYSFEFLSVVGGLCRARNEAVDDALKAGSQFIVWIDGDLDADPESGMTLADSILRLLSHRQPIVGMLYCKRAKRPQWACSFLSVATLEDDTQRDGLLQVVELAGGATCVHAKVYSEMARIYGSEDKSMKGTIRYRDRDSGETRFGHYQNVVIDGDLLSEDYWFSYLARCAQICLLVDTKLKLRHHGTDWDGKDVVYPDGDFPPIPVEGL